MIPRKRLSDILSGSDREQFDRLWKSTTAASDLGPIPAGNYRCLILSGEASTAKSGTAGYKLTLEVLDGEFASRRLWYDIWLTPAALGIAKRDLAKLGIRESSQLDQPLPSGIIVDAKVALRRNDDGTESNRIRSFEVVEVRRSGPDPFAPDDADADGFDWRNGEQHEGGEIK